ncbi:hypothetical protein EsH8_I_000820 [Colletotrichum jinshuiense]
MGEGPYYADALVYYNRALQYIMRSPATEDACLSVLMTCLLFMMFEALQGDRRAAMTHLNHGYTILDQYQRRVGKVRNSLAQAIVSNFQRLTLQSWSHGGDHPKETEKRVPWCCRGQRERYAVDEMPDAFGTIDEAHRWWEITQHHVIHHAPLIIGFRVEGTGNKAATFPPSQGLSMSPEHVKQQIRFIQQWHARFQPLAESRAINEEEHQESLKLLGLQIHSIYLSIPVMTANYTDPEALAAMTPAFREYVTLSEEFLDIQQRNLKNTGEVFTMDSNSPTWPLGAAAMVCVDESVRANATSLLRKYPRRDGLWDTQVWLSMLHNYKEAKQAISRRTAENELPHEFDVELVYDEESVVWIRHADDPASVSQGDLEYRISLP